MGIVTLGGSLELLRLGPAAHGEKFPRKNEAFIWEEKSIPKSPWGIRGSHLPASQTSRTLKDRDIHMDEPHWTQAPAALMLQLDLGLSAPGFGKGIPKTRAKLPGEFSLGLIPANNMWNIIM